MIRNKISTKYMDILLITAVVLVGLLFCFSKETFDFNRLSSVKLPDTEVEYDGLPYCTDKFGHPVACKKPCYPGCKACNWQYPVPNFGVTAGGYSPDKWCPGKPFC